MATNPIDDWFLGYKTRAVKSKDRGGLYLGHDHRPSKPLKSGSGLTNLKAAALKHDGVDAGFLQLQRHGDACSAAADDTDLGLNDGARGQFVGVDQHGWFLLGTQCCEGKHLTLKGKCLSSSG